MQIYYFSTALSDEIYNEIVKKSKKYKPTFSGVGFDRNVAVGLSEFANIQGVSYYPIPSYPKYNRMMEKSTSFSQGGFKCFVPGVFDLPILKEFSYFFRTIKYVKKNLDLSYNNVIVISGLYRCLLRPAKYLKKKYGIKVCAIVPDLLELMITYRKDYSGFRQFLNKIDVKKSQEYRDCVDAFVFLSKYMNEPVNKNNMPAVIVDGLTDIVAFPAKEENTTSDRIILYAGKVSSTFGVDKLVNAFLQAHLDQDVKLHICGDGDYAPNLREIANEHDNIVFHGSVSHDEVLRLEISATLLVDPRPSNMEIVKMSFPSKIIEYMASGTPVLTTNLPCFSDEYRHYQFRIDEESEEGMVDALQTVFNLSREELNEKGINARKFILENKTISKQCKKIMDLINGLGDNE